MQERTLLRIGAVSLIVGFVLTIVHAALLVVSCVAVDERNEVLAACLRGTGIPNLSDWSSLFQGNARFAVFTHQQWVEWVRSHDANGQWRDWLSYVESRYGYAK